MESFWVSLGLALVAALSINSLLGRLGLSRTVHGILAAGALAGSFAIYQYVHPSDAPWPKAIGACLVGVAFGEFSLAVRSQRRRKTA